MLHRPHIQQNISSVQKPSAGLRHQGPASIPRFYRMGSQAFKKKQGSRRSNEHCSLYCTWRSDWRQCPAPPGPFKATTSVLPAVQRDAPPYRRCSSGHPASCTTVGASDYVLGNHVSSLPHPEDRSKQRCLFPQKAGLCHSMEHCVSCRLSRRTPMTCGCVLGNAGAGVFLPLHCSSERCSDAQKLGAFLLR